MTQNKDKYQQPETYCPAYEDALIAKSRQADSEKRPDNRLPVGLQLRINELRAQGLIGGDPSGTCWD